MIPANYSPKNVEKEVKEFWKNNKIYEKSRGTDKKKFFFVDGPPYPTGRIHLGTAWNKIIKDVILRYKRMRGYTVLDTPGWDMHGLPVEVKVENELGFKTKTDIEKYGIDLFVEKCMNYALDNMHTMTDQFKELGVWMDWDNPYVTIKAEYVNAAWWTIKRAYDQDLLEQKKMVVNWCPRCETALADAEIEYWEEEDPSIFVKFPIDEDTFIVIWTTTPWTIPGNMAVAVHPSLEYGKFKAVRNNKVEYLILAKELADSALEKGGYDSWELIETYLGEDLVGTKYEHPLEDEVPVHQRFQHQVYMADFVSAENTGCVHIAPGHGLEDYELGMQEGIEVFNPVDDKGDYTKEGGKYEGEFVRRANDTINEDLEEKDLLMVKDRIIHRYGHCWRCKNPIIYRATEQWFLKVSDIKEDMLSEIDRVKWVPVWAGMSRFKDWVSNAKDWCISRQRYWGIPLPIWRCQNCDNIKVVGDIHQLGWKEDLDLHRPNVDSVTFDCECGGKMYRIEDVFDVWFDSGVASWGTLRYPSEKDEFEELWPADFITEGHDQTRGWFYSQLGAGVVAHGKAPYKIVLTHGFTLDDQGRKMSKSLGNVVDPEEVAQEVGVDCFRLYSLSSALWEDLRFNWDEVKNYNRVLNIFWNAIRFAHLYMSLDEFKETEVKEFNIEDEWILSRLESFNHLAMESLEDYQLHKVVRAFQNFMVEDFSRWYIQLIRNRVWEEKDSPSKIAAYSVILKVVDKITRIMAPYMPYLAEWVHQHFTREFKDVKESVFMETFPQPDKELIDAQLESYMGSVREIYEAASNARQKANIKLRWPLGKLYVEVDSKHDEVKNAVNEFSGLIKSQCNVKEVEVVDEFPRKVSIKPNFKALGPLLKERAQDFASYVSSLSEEEIEDVVEKGRIKFEGEEFNLNDVCFVEYSVPEGYQLAEFSGGFIYLYTERDDELVREGYARELVRRIQEMRKEMDLNVDDFIQVSLDMSSQFLEGWLDYIKTETRAQQLEFESPQDGYTREWDIEGNKVNIGVKKI